MSILLVSFKILKGINIILQTKHKSRLRHVNGVYSVFMKVPLCSLSTCSVCQGIKTEVLTTYFIALNYIQLQYRIKSDL